eukprot:1180844-Prorocentrum_minimum.AAC.3
MKIPECTVFFQQAERVIDFALTQNRSYTRGRSVMGSYATVTLQYEYTRAAETDVGTLFCRMFYKDRSYKTRAVLT